MENNEKGKNKDLVIIILAVLLLATCGFICYDKVLKKDTTNPNGCPKCQEYAKKQPETDCVNASVLGEKINSLKEINITTTNQAIKIGNTTYNIKKGTYEGNDGYLSIDDNIVNYPQGEGKVWFDKAYLTDKFIFFTAAAQEGYFIQYVLGEKGSIMYNNNLYEMNNAFKIVDGYLHTSGHIFCGDGNLCPDNDLLIKYIDNTLIVTEAK